MSGETASSYPEPTRTEPKAVGAVAETLSETLFVARARPADWLTSYTGVMRVFSLLFAFIALVVLAMSLIYVIRGPVDPLIAAGLFVSFLACLAPALYLLKPLEPPEGLRRRREEARKEREGRHGSSGDGSRDPGS